MINTNDTGLLASPRRKEKTDTWTPVLEHLLVGGFGRAGGRRGVFSTYTLEPWHWFRQVIHARAWDSQCPSNLFTLGQIHSWGAQTLAYLAKVRNQNNPAALPWAPWAAVARVAPTTMRPVVRTSAAFLPILSQTRPTTIWPMIAPVVSNWHPSHKKKEND